METIRSLFEQYSGNSSYTLTALPSSGSHRQYFRISYRGGSCIAVAGTDATENSAFIYMAGHFRSLGLPVPEVLAVSQDGMCYLQEDLGDTTLFDAVAEGRMKGSYSKDECALLHKAVSYLPAFQFTGAKGMDFSKCRPIERFDRMSVMFDLNYFKYCFLKPSGLEFSETALEEDFISLCNRLLKSNSCNFQYRDFQGRNIMISPEGEMFFIDFQGGRMGPPHYDLASFLWQAKARYSPELKRQLTDTYLDSMSEYCRTDRNAFLEELRHFVLFRTLQVLGAYGFRGLYERRPHFLESIPYAMDNLKELLSEPFREYPYLCRLLLQLVPVFGHRETCDDGLLHIRIYSFSYKKGIPSDESGNGGGYVFDCRGVPNPGRLPEYRSLTGMDAPVIGFLESRSETGSFAGLTAQMADMHIDNYLERGFSSLMFCFGCTGGRHRSVYFAERLAGHIMERYGNSGKVKITVTHREQNIVKTLI